MYDWNVRNIAKISPKIAKISPKTAVFRLFSIFANTLHTIRTKISTVTSYTIVWSMCAISTNSYNWDWSESEGKRPKPTPLPHMRLWLNILRVAEYQKIEGGPFIAIKRILSVISRFRTSVLFLLFVLDVLLRFELLKFEVVQV